MRRRFGTTAALGAATLLAGLLMLEAGVAFASKVADYFKGHVIVSDKRFPSSFASDGAFIAYMKKADRTEIKCTKDGVWELYYMAFFAKPIDDVQVSVNFYDLTEGGDFLMTAEEYTSSRSERILASYIKLTRDEIPSNHKIKMVVLRRGKAVASTDVGVKMRDDRKFKGKVDFGDDET